MILIYNDNGASSASVDGLIAFFSKRYKVKSVSGSDMQEGSCLDKATAFVMPGGRSLPFYEKLGSAGNKNIRHFVERGGTYFGICAGAYYASSETVFSKGGSLELIFPGQLHFFKSCAVGPVFASDDFAYHSEKGARIIDVQWQDGQRYSTYFNGGCFFENASTLPNVQVLATYTDNKKPCVILGEVGRGKVVLSGVHPELGYQSIPDDLDPHHQQLRQTLINKDQSRMALAARLFKLKWTT